MKTPTLPLMLEQVWIKIKRNGNTFHTTHTHTHTHACARTRAHTHTHYKSLEFKQRLEFQLLWSCQPTYSWCSPPIGYASTWTWWYHPRTTLMKYHLHWKKTEKVFFWCSLTGAPWRRSLAVVPSPVLTVIHDLTSYFSEKIEADKNFHVYCLGC